MEREKISTRLKYILKYRGITQAELARATNISKSMVTAYIKGLYLPKPNTITLFANFFKVNEAWLMGYNVPMVIEENEIKEQAIGDRIKYALKYRNKKQVDLAVYLNIDRATIHNYLANKYAPGKERLSLIAECLDVNPAWLAGYDVPMEKTADEKKGKYGEYDLLVEGFKNLKNEQKELIKSMIKLFEIENKKG